MHDEELHTLHSSPNSVFQIKADEMDVTWENEGHIQKFSQKI
jgi:hypothetical protein